MKPTPHGSRRRAPLIFPFLILSLIFAPPGAATTTADPQTQTPTAGAQHQQQAAPNVSGTQNFTVSVMNGKGEFLAGLTKEEFSVWEGKTEREINYFTGEELPASVAVLVDASGSVDSRILSASKYAAAKFLAEGNPANEYFVGEFSYAWRGVLGWVQGPRAIADAAERLSAESLITSHTKARGRGQTALYDACDAALDALAKRSKPRRILILLTDGQDNQSSVKFNELRKKIRALDVQVYGIGLQEKYESPGLNVAGQAILDELTLSSGGRSYFPEDSKDRKELDQVIERILMQLRHQYVIGFTPTNAAQPGKWNKVKIKVAPRGANRKSFVVIGRDGYFSPPQTPAP
jgi:Ca-activated chloride channel family protein